MQAAAVGAIVMAFPPLFESFLMLIGMLIIALFIDWQVTLVSLMAVPLIYCALGDVRHAHRAAGPIACRRSSGGRSRSCSRRCRCCA